MSDPQTYTVDYDFTAFQANAPDEALPANKLQTELNNIATAIGSIITALAQIRRSDGVLNNGIVDYDALASSLQFLVDPTNGEAVAAAVAQVEANAIAVALDKAAAAASAVSASDAADIAVAAASGVNLTNYLTKSGNLAGLANIATARATLELGTAALLDHGTLANQLLKLVEDGVYPALNGSKITGIDVLPVGTSIAVNATSAPAGTLIENGALIARVDYSRLWDFAQASGNIVNEATWAAGSYGAFSTGDLLTTFRLMDSRGVFIRGYDSGRGLDSGRNISAYQADAFKDHTHSVPSGGPVLINGAAGSAGNGNIYNVAQTTGNASTGAGTETRPKNNAKLICIKY